MKSISIVHKQSGAVSLFVVIFAMLLISVVTIGFLRIMTSDQNKATGSDLAQSAYDSAQAGVEDAKRALLWYSQNCTGGATHVNCTSFESAATQCNSSIRGAGVVDVDSGTGTGEIKVQQSSTLNTTTGESIDNALDQAYTCVKMQLDTPDYKTPLRADESVLIPLVSSTTFNTITVEWFNRDDVSGATGAVDTPTSAPPRQLVTPWPPDRPSVMRTQFMQVGARFTLSDFDTTTASSESNANTVFLYPHRSGSTAATMATTDRRKDGTGASLPGTIGSTPLPTRCQTIVSSSDTYACSITLQLPTPVNGGNRATAYLRLTSLYAASNIRITLGNGAYFRAVQPAVDATGRANDVFRRVESRIDLYDTTFPYPDAAVDTAGNFCKDFGVTKDFGSGDAYFPGSCTQ